MRPLLAAGLIALAAVAGTVAAPRAQELRVSVDVRDAVALSQAAIGRAVEDRTFTDESGRPVGIASFRGKPLVVSLVYSGCGDICPPSTQRLLKAVSEAQDIMGADRFAVVTLGIDARNDTPARMGQFRRIQGIDLPQWTVLSGNSEAITGFARDLGFTFVPGAGGFDHLAQVSILDRDGVVARQIYGDDFPIQVFMEALKESVYGTQASFATLDAAFDRIRFLCTVFDPSRGRYRVSYAIVATLFTGILSLGATGWVLARAWIRSARA